MEKVILTLINNRHLLYIIQEYLIDREYTFLPQLEHKTNYIKAQTSRYLYYNQKITDTLEYKIFSLPIIWHIYHDNEIWQDWNIGGYY